MENQLPTKLSPRKRGLWPRDQTVQHATVPVMIHLGKDEWDWLSTALGSPDELGHSELWNVEGVISNAIRYMRDDPGYLARLALELKEMAGEELTAEERALDHLLSDQRKLPHFDGEGTF